MWVVIGGLEECIGGFDMAGVFVGSRVILALI